MKPFTKMLRNDSGVTLLELIISIAVLSVTLSIGFPAFQSLIRENRVTAASHALHSSIFLARSEAVNGRGRVTICASSDATSCTADTDWHSGWIVFEDHNANAQRDNTEVLLRVHQRQFEGMTITGNQPVRDYVSYIASGTTRSISGALQMGTISFCAQGSGREIVINALGRPRVTKTEC